MLSNTTTKYRRPVRINKGEVYPYVPAGYEDELTRNVDPEYINKPIYYCVEVQVKIWFFWVTVWTETCKPDDQETREYIENCAEEVAEYMSKEV